MDERTLVLILARKVCLCVRRSRRKGICRLSCRKRMSRSEAHAGEGAGAARVKVPRGMVPWNPTLAHRTRKDGAPAVYLDPRRKQERPQNQADHFFSQSRTRAVRTCARPAGRLRKRQRQGRRSRRKGICRLGWPKRTSRSEAHAGEGARAARVKVPRGMVPWNPTLAHRTRKDKAPAVYLGPRRKPKETAKP